MGKLLKSLFVAFLNATLLLIAICLFLGWKLSTSVNSTLASFASNLEIVAPLRSDLGAVAIEIAALRTDLAALKTGTGEASSAAVQSVVDRTTRLEANLSGITEKFDAVAKSPEALVDHAIETSVTKVADEVSRTLIGLRNCTPADPR